MIILSGYLVSALLFLVSMGTSSREALVIALVGGAAACLWPALRFVRDFPNRPLTDLLAGTLGAGILGGSIMQNITYLQAGALNAEAGELLQSSWDVPGVSLASLVVISCCATLVAVGLVPQLRRFLVLPVPKLVRHDAPDMLSAFIITGPVVLTCLWMVATGVVSIDSSPYSANANESSKSLGPLYIITFGLLPSIPALMARYVAEKSLGWHARVLGLVLMTGAMAAVFVAGRRIFVGTIVSGAIFFAFQRGWRVTYTQMALVLPLLAAIFFGSSAIFLQARQAQSAQRSVSIAEMFKTGQLSGHNDTIDTQTRIASRAAFLGELADLVEKLPATGKAYGLATLTNLAFVIPDAVWPGKKDFIENQMWDDAKIEGAAGNISGQYHAGIFRKADIADTVVMYSWVDFGFFSPLWCALQMIAFVGAAHVLSNIARFGLFRVLNACTLIGFCLVPDATSASAYAPLLRQTLIFMILTSVAYGICNAILGKRHTTQAGQRRVVGRSLSPRNAPGLDTRGAPSSRLSENANDAV